MDDNEDLSARVDALLAADGLRGDEATRSDLIAMYATLRPGVAAMHELAEVRHESPALVFEPELRPTGWTP